MDLDKIYDRTEIVLGKEKLEALKKSHVVICGIGGVGSYTLEALARIGVGHITVVDKDTVDVTNINRQIIATVDNVGNSKVEVAKKRVSLINPNIKVDTVKEFIDETNIPTYITKDVDYVIDAIDSTESKIALIKYCKKENIQIISSMGTANKLDPLKLTVTDISKTEMCPLAKIVRKRLKEEGITKVKVVYSTEATIKTNGAILGSVSFVPSVAGLIIASEVVKDLTNSIE